MNYFDQNIQEILKLFSFVKNTLLSKQETRINTKKIVIQARNNRNHPTEMFN